MTENADITEEAAQRTPVETDHYAEEAPLAYLLGDSARVNIISAFVSERGRDVSVSDIARLADVARSTVYNHLDSLERLGVIKHTREVEDGHSPLYQLNDDNEIAELCYKLEGTTLRRLINENYLE
jgi:DNA-binding transcriptional ArsR family regulator